MITYYGNNDWSERIADALESSIFDLSMRFPRFYEDIQGLSEIRIIDTHENKDLAGFYDPFNRIVVVVADVFNDFKEAIYVMLHEIGHHFAEKKRPIARDYNSRRKNASYYREEIKADSYAVRVIKFLGYESFKEIIIEGIARIKGHKDELMYLLGIKTRISKWFSSTFQMSYTCNQSVYKVNYANWDTTWTNVVSHNNLNLTLAA